MVQLVFKFQVHMKARLTKLKLKHLYFFICSLTVKICLFVEEKKVVKAGSSILKFVRQKPDKEQHNEDKLKQEDRSLGTEKNPSQANSSTGREPNSASFEANSTPREINSTPLEADNDQELSTSVADLDPEVLAALPEDIRLEVLAQYKISRQDVAENITPPPPPVSPQPGPSRYRQDEPTASKDKVEDPVVSSAATSMADLSFSQIDNSVLSELPPELRDEITNHFQRQAVEVKRNFVHVIFV